MQMQINIGLDNAAFDTPEYEDDLSQRSGSALADTLRKLADRVDGQILSLDADPYDNTITVRDANGNTVLEAVISA